MQRDELLIVGEVLLISDVSGEQDPRLPRVPGPHLQPVLRVLLHGVRVLDGPRVLGRPCVVEVSFVVEHVRVPVEIDDIEEMLEGFEVDPEYSIIHLCE